MNRRYWRILVAGIVFQGVLFSGCDLGFFGNLKAKVTEEKDWTLSSEGITLIDTQTTNGTIVVTASDTNDIQVHAVKIVRAKTEEEAADFAQKVILHAEKDGDTLKIYKEHPRHWNRVNVSVNFTVACPKMMDVLLRSTNGKITIEGIEKTVDAGTTNGRIRLEGGRDKISLRSTNGSIEMRESSGQVDARTTNGSITAHLDQYHDAADFSTTNGSIHVEIESGQGSIDATTTNGSIDVSLPSDYSGQLDAGVVHGKVTSDFTVPVKKPSKKKLQGTIGDGGNNTLYFRTTNGNIHIRKKQNPV